MRLDDGLSAPRASARVLKRALFDGRETESVEIKAGDTVAEAVAARTPNLTDEERRSLRVVSYERDAEHVIAPDLWHRVKLKPGAFLVITDPPASGAFRSILQIVIAVAALALAGPLGGVLAGALSISAAAGTAIAAAGLAAVGSLLLNLIVPLPKGLDNDSPSPLYTAEGFKNPLNVGGPIPLPVGLRHRFAPPYMVPPFIDVEDDKIFLTAVFCCGYAPARRWNESIGDRLLERFDSRYWTLEARGFADDEGDVDNSPFTIVPETVIQRGQQVSLLYREAGVGEDEDGPRALPTIMETEPDTTRWKAILSCPQGLYRRSDKGSLGSYNIDLRIRTRPLTPDNSAEWELVENFSIVRADISPFYFEIEYNVAGDRGAYEVDFLRMSAVGTGGDEVADCQIIAFQSILPEYPINEPDDAPFAKIGLRIQATNQLKGTLDEFNLEVASLIPAWDEATETWVPKQETGNPANILRWLYTMPQNAKRIAANRVFEVELLDWRQHNNANDLKFSRVYDYETSLDAVIREVCAVGRAVPRMTDGLRGVSIDRPKAAATAFPLTPHNTWGFEATRSYKESDIHGWRIKFRDRTNEFKTAIREVVRPDLPVGVEATNFQEIEPPGVTDPTQAYVWGYKLWLEVLHRPDTYTRNIAIQSRLLQHGDLCAMSHRLLHGAQQSGRVVSVIGKLVTLSEPVEMEAAKSYGVKFQRIEEIAGGLGRSKVVSWGVETVPGETRVLKLVGSGDLPEEGDLAWFGRESIEDVLAVVQNIEPNEDFNARLTLVDQAPQIFDILDDLVVPPWSSRIGSILPPDDRPPPPPVIKRIMSGRGVYAKDETATDEPRRVVTYVKPGQGQPKATQFKLRHRKVGTTDWTDTPWRGMQANAFALNSAYDKGDFIEMQPRGRTPLAVESSVWGDIVQHSVGASDPDGPEATDLDVEFDDDEGTVTYSWKTPNDTDRARLYYGPAGVTTVAEMTKLHTGYLTSSPYVSTKPSAAGAYKFAVLLQDEDNIYGDLVLEDFSVDAPPAPPKPEDPLLEPTSPTSATVSCRAGDFPRNTVAIRFYRRPQGQAWDINTATLLDTLPAVPGQGRALIDRPGDGTWLYDFIAENKHGTLSPRADPTQTGVILPLGDYDFANDTYSGPTLSISGGANGMVQDVAGVWSAGRRSNKGRLVEPAATNYFRNTDMAGAVVGTPGTAPNNWTLSTSASGLVRQIVAVGTENGLPCIDVRWTGGAGNSFIIAPEGASFAAVAGQQYVATLIPRMIAGATTNLTFNRRFLTTPSNSTTGSAAFTMSGTANRLVFSRTIPTGDTGGRPQIITASPTGPFDITIRIYGVQVEDGLTATSPIRTTGAATVTRSADVVSLTLPAETTKIRYIFDDGSIQIVTAAPGFYQIPTNLNRPQIARMVVY